MFIYKICEIQFPCKVFSIYIIQQKNRNQVKHRLNVIKKSKNSQEFLSDNKEKLSKRILIEFLLKFALNCKD